MELVCRSKCGHIDCGEGICVTTGGSHICDCNEGFTNFNDNISMPCGKTSNLNKFVLINYIKSRKRFETKNKFDDS